MGYSNLPPGVRECDIPGSRPEDVAWLELREEVSDVIQEMSDLREFEREFLYDWVTYLTIIELRRWLAPTVEMVQEALQERRHG